MRSMRWLVRSKKTALLAVFLTALLATVLAPAARAADQSQKQSKDQSQSQSQDQRDDFEVSFYFGDSVSSFAATEARQLENPEDNNKVLHGFVAGLDFQYRLKKTGGDHSLWVYGETVHGLRSSDLNCKDNPDADLCRDQARSGQDVVFVLRNATSLEANAGFRWEFARIEGTHPARPEAKAAGRAYLVGEAGFITVAGNGGDFVNNDFLGVGARIIEGRFEGSRLEAGWGRTDLYLEHRSRRLKIDGELEVMINEDEKTKQGKDPVLGAFAEMYIDSDLGRGSDSAFIFFGFSFDVGAVLKNRSPSTSPTVGGR